MIKITQGNIFESNCEALVNTVNCTGIMGETKNNTNFRSITPPLKTVGLVTPS